MPTAPSTTVSVSNSAATITSPSFHDVFSTLPDVRFVRVQWVDLTGTLRLRVLPISALRKSTNLDKLNLSLAIAGLQLLQDDTPTPTLNAAGMYALVPIWPTLRPTAVPGHAAAMCNIRDRKTGADLSICPRTALSHAITRAADHEISFLVGFEIEVVFVARNADGSLQRSVKEAHAWSTATALTPERTDVMDTIVTMLETAGIEVSMYHAESCDGQFEVVTGPLPPLEAVDALYHTRQIIETVARRHGLRATLHPKPYAMQAGNAIHTHISLQTGKSHENAFMAGVLKRLPPALAFGYASCASYRRSADSSWSGGTWVGWGDENREVPIRRILVDGEGAERWEIRCHDGTANAYYFLAAVINAGVLGVKEGLKLGDGCEKNPALLTATERNGYGITKRLPESLDVALEKLAKDKKLVELMGELLCSEYRAIKCAEVEKISKLAEEDKWEWEVERY